MARLLLLVLCLWLSAPASLLCLGGELVHPCEGSVCSHEEDCAGDPCDPVLLRSEPEGPAPLAVLVADPAGLAAAPPARGLDAPPALRTPVDRSIPAGTLALRS